MVSSKMILVTILISFFMFSCVSSTEFEVGGKDGWVVPKSRNHADMFNRWASDNRFKIGDTVRFKYKADSVLVVSEEEYKNCKASKPEFYSNSEDTVFKLDRPGFFYFMSGVSGHCEKGQKMIIKVMDMEASPVSPPPPSTPSTPSSSESSPVSPPPSASPAASPLPPAAVASPPPSASSSSSAHPASTHKKSNALKTSVRFSNSGFVVISVLVLLSGLV